MLPTILRTPRALLLSAAVALGAAACSLDTALPGNSLGPIIQGTYNLARLEARPLGATSSTDLLAAGARLQLILGENNTVTGSLTIPGGTPLPAGTFDMAGRWDRSVAGGQVTLFFTQNAPTFVRDLTWTPRAQTADTLGSLTGIGESSRVEVVARLDRVRQ